MLYEVITGRRLQGCFTVWAGSQILIVVFFLSVATNLSFAAEESKPAGQATPTEMVQPPADQASQASLDDRITSYNVCYTKLLRDLD